MQSLQTLVKRWYSELVEPLPPESTSAVQATFAALGVQATPDVLALYASIGGMRIMDNHYWRLWPLDEVSAENSRNPSENGLIFSDFLMESWLYRIKPTGNGTSAVYVDCCDEYAPQVVANSLEQFFDLYLADPRGLLDLQSQSLVLKNFELELW